MGNASGMNGTHGMNVCLCANQHPNSTQAAPKQHLSSTQAAPKQHASSSQAIPKQHPSSTQQRPSNTNQLMFGGANCWLWVCAK
eukprot:1208741-Lingulodinium_polyedra.AAC.1